MSRAMRWAPVAAAIGMIAMLSSGCVAGGGYGYGGEVGIGADYYEPYGIDYGGWGPGYRVGPFRGGDHRGGFGGRSGTHAYRSAPASRSMPSIPSGARGGGGGRGGGGHGGGGGRGGGGHR